MIISPIKLGKTRSKIREDVLNKGMEWTLETDVDLFVERLSNGIFEINYRYINYLLIIFHYLKYNQIIVKFSLNKFNELYDELIDEMKDTEYEYLIMNKNKFIQEIVKTIYILYEKLMLFPTFDKFQLPQKIQLYHGLEDIEKDIFINTISNLSINDNFILSTFMSTSLNEKVANRFAININDSDNKIQFLINIDSSVYNKIRYTYMDKNISDLSNISSNVYSASEFLLIFGSVLKLTNIINDKVYTYTRQIQHKDIYGQYRLVNEEITELFNIYVFDFINYINKLEDLNDLTKLHTHFEKNNLFGKSKKLRNKKLRNKKLRNKKLKILQKLAKKKSIKITKIVRGKRKYKTKKELIKNLKLI